MSAKHWLTVRNEAEKPAEILITGQIGKDWFDDSGTSEKEFLNALEKIPADKAVLVGINSEGGSVKDGIGIYNALRRRENVTTRIDGYAVSIASVIALAGDRRISPKSSIWMIHEPWAFAHGNAEDMLKAAAMLEAHGQMIADIYTERTGITKEKARDLMRAETWFKGDEAVSMAFATEQSDEVVALNKLDPTRYRNIPQDILKETLAAATKEATQPATPKCECAPVTVAAAQISPAVEVGDGNTEPMIRKPQNQGGKMPEEKKEVAAPTQTADVAALQDSIASIAQEIKAMRNQPVQTPRVEITREGLNELLDQKTKNPSDRFNFIKNNWTALAASFPVVKNANTDTAAGTLTTAILASGVITVLQNRLAPLAAFSRNFSTGRVSGRNVIEVPKVTAGGTAQSNPTSFEDTTNFVASVDDIAITPAHLVSGAHITNAELQNGWRMAWWVEIKLAELANKVQQAVNAIITTGNFTGTPETSSAAEFTSSNLKSLWGKLKKSPVKNILLDGEYYAKFLPDNMENFNPLDNNRYPGWDGFYLNTEWTGATANTVGFACNPQAIAVGAALPPQMPNMGGPGVTEEIVTLPGLGLSVANYQWFSTSSRTGWWTVDVMFGAAKGDENAGFLLMSA